MQELELQLIERAAGTVICVNLYLRPALWGHRSPWTKSLLCLETASRACTMIGSVRKVEMETGTQVKVEKALQT